MKKGHVFKSKNERFQLIIKELEEPNYGRLLWRFSFSIDGKIIKNSQINEYSGLTENLKEYTFNSINNNYIFLPIENGYLLYNTKSEKFEKLPNNSVGPNNDFVSNYYTSNFLVINRKREIQIVNLNTMNAINASFSFGKLQI